VIVELETLALVGLIVFALGYATARFRHDQDYIHGYVAGLRDMRARFVRPMGRDSHSDTPRALIAGDDLTAGARQASRRM